MKKKILIMEDDRKVLEILSFALGREGYQVFKASDGLAGVQFCEEHDTDLILLDLAASFVDSEASSMDSFETCRCLREEGTTSPILVCVASHEEAEKALDLGASDYILKPFSMKELLLRVNANTWHMEMPPSEIGALSKRQVFGRITIYPDRSVVTKDETELSLTQREYNLLCFLAKAPGKTFSREVLLHEVWEYTGYIGDLRAVDVIISRLREKIEDDPANPSLIITRRGHGYMLKDQ